MSSVFTRQNGGRISVFCGIFSIDFDIRYGEKKYPFLCNLHNVKLSDRFISIIESSSIVKVDPEFSSYSQQTGNSILYLVPNADYTLESIMQVFCNLVKALNDEHEYEIE